MMKKIVIIGGGVAGLAAACRLAEIGKSPLLIESGSYPSHKICGEFFSPECLSTLRNWGIEPPSCISRVSFLAKNSTFDYPLPSKAGGMSHPEFDPLLVRYAEQNGAVIRTETKVQTFICPSDDRECYTLTLSDGEVVQAESVIIATGRLPLLATPTETRYVGFKAHFKGIALKNTLEMYLFPGAYIGFGAVSSDIVNVAGIARKEIVEGDVETFLNALAKTHGRFSSRLYSGTNLFSKWMTGAIGEFGIKKTPTWPRAYFIGDAAGTIPPACGDGLAMAIASGCLAAEYAARSDVSGFNKEWTRCFLPRIKWGRLFHRALMNPIASYALIRASHCFSCIPRYIFGSTRNT